MPFDRKSKIRDAWRVPAGRDMLLLLMRQQALSESWPERAMVARRSIASLEKLAGPEFIDLLLDAVNTNDEPLPPKPGEGCGPTWWKQAVAYRIYLPSFMDGDHDGVGDLVGALQRLPYLESLGVDTLWLSCLQAPMPGIKPVPVTEIQPDYGTLEDFEALIEGAKARDMRVVLDLDAVGNAAVLQEGMAFWRGLGVDGFCLVNLNLLGKPAVVNLPGAGPAGLRRFLCGPALRARVKELAAAAREEDSGLFIAGEVPLASCTAAMLFCTGMGGNLDLLLETGHLMRPVPPELPQLDLQELKARYLRFYETGGCCWLPLTLQNADLPRLVSRVGANGVYRTALAKMLATLTLTLRGTPVLFQGEELGLANTRFVNAGEMRDERALSAYEELRMGMGEKQALEHAMRQSGDHARAPFPWSAGAGGGFSGAVPWLRTVDGIEFLNASVQMGDKNSVWNHYAQLVHLRHTVSAFVYGEIKPVFARNKKVFCYFRIQDGEKWYIETNLTGNETVRPGRILPSMRLEVSNYGTQARALRPYEANVYRCL